MLRSDQIALLDDVPSYWRFALTGGENDAKRCFELNWNHEGNGLRLGDALRINDAPTPSETWKSRRMIGLGVITGAESQGLLVLDFDGVGSQAVRAFRKHFHQFPSKLPKTIMNISGKSGRAKLFFAVPQHWWPELGDRSASWRGRDNKALVLEAIWANGTGRGRHAVVVGDHPESSFQNPLFYRWVKGHSPADMGPAEAPEWLLMGILAQMEASTTERTREERNRYGDDDATPWERLKSWERIELVDSALDSCPNRNGRSSGTYEQARRILAALINEFGLEIATMIVERSDWNTKNEWDGDRDAAKTMLSLSKSKVAEDQKSNINSVFFLARQNGWLSPPWAVPPLETKAQIDGLKKLINQMNTDSKDDVAMAVYIGRARREYGVDSATFRRLALRQVLGALDISQGLYMDEVVSNSRTDNQTDDVIDGFLKRSVHVIAGASHSGKTTLACFLANRVVTESPIDIEGTRHIVSKAGKVLFFTSDCSDEDLIRELMLEGVTPELAAKRLMICPRKSFDDMLSIVKILDEFQPDLVIYDCLTSMACSDVKIGDPAYADPIRLLVQFNGKAWPKCSHVILHHTSRDEPTRFSGSEQIKAAADELWAYYPPELLKWKKGAPRPEVGSQRHLVMEKSRGGYAGKLISVSRDGFQGFWQFRQPNTQRDNPSEVLVTKFRGVRHERWQLPSEWAEELDLAFSTRSLIRYLNQLSGSILEVERRYTEKTRRQDWHYRPRPSIRQAAQEMVGSRCDGINAV
tara:strand:- start:1524 stop:3782 length:2259 start_codon:yes stop_codon:yes gene_type:complete